MLADSQLLFHLSTPTSEINKQAAAAAAAAAAASAAAAAATTTTKADSSGVDRQIYRQAGTHAGSKAGKGTVRPGKRFTKLWRY